MKLYIGNKNYSSWSLRGWLATRLSDANLAQILSLYGQTAKAYHQVGGMVRERLDSMQFRDFDLDAPNLLPNERGYHGPIKMLVGLDRAGLLTGVVVDSDTATIFGGLTASNSYAGELDKSLSGIANIDFAKPAGSNVEFSIEAWVKGNPQSVNAGIIVKGYGNGGEQFNLDTGSSNAATHAFRFSIHERCRGYENLSCQRKHQPDQYARRKILQQL